MDPEQHTPFTHTCFPRSDLSSKHPTYFQPRHAVKPNNDHRRYTPAHFFLYLPADMVSQNQNLKLKLKNSTIDPSALPKVRERSQILRDASCQVAPPKVEPLHRVHAASPPQEGRDGSVDGVVVVQYDGHSHHALLRPRCVLFRGAFQKNKDEVRSKRKFPITRQAGDHKSPHIRLRVNGRVSSLRRVETHKLLPKIA